jgi:hypothetical protein
MGFIWNVYSYSMEQTLKFALIYFYHSLQQMFYWPVFIPGQPYAESLH